MAAQNYQIAIDNARALVKDNKIPQAITLLQITYQAYVNGLNNDQNFLAPRLHVLKELTDIKVKTFESQTRYNDMVTALNTRYDVLNAAYAITDSYMVLNTIANVRGTLTKDYQQASIDYDTIITHYLTVPLLAFGVYKVMFLALLCDTVKQLVNKRNGKIDDSLLQHYKDTMDVATTVFQQFTNKTEYKYITGITQCINNLHTKEDNWTTLAAMTTQIDNYNKVYMPDTTVASYTHSIMVLSTVRVTLGTMLLPEVLSMVLSYY